MSDENGPKLSRRVRRWWLVDGDRRVVTGLMVAAAFVVSAGLILGDVVIVGAQSNLPSVLGSGIVAGLATLITITLSVNQLILSRLLSPPKTLRNRLEGALEYRQRAEELTDETTMPNDAAEFLAVIGENLRDRASTVRDELEDDDSVAFASELEDYGDNLSNASESDTTVGALSNMLSSRYARLLTAAREQEQRLDNDASTAAAAALYEARELLELSAVVRQFLKTLAIQQDLATLSKRLSYLGVFGLGAAVATSLVYSKSSVVSVQGPLLVWVVSGAFAAVSAPFAVLVSHVLRIATVTKFTGSVGPFVAPEGDIWEW